MREHRYVEDPDIEGRCCYCGHFKATHRGVEKSKAQRNHEASLRGNDALHWEFPAGPYPIVRWQEATWTNV